MKEGAMRQGTTCVLLSATLFLCVTIGSGSFISYIFVDTQALRFIAIAICATCLIAGIILQAIIKRRQSSNRG